MLTRWPAMFVLMAVAFLIGGLFKRVRSKRRLEEMSEPSYLWRRPSDTDAWRPEDGSRNSRADPTSGEDPN